MEASQSQSQSQSQPAKKRKRGAAVVAPAEGQIALTLPEFDAALGPVLATSGALELSPSTTFRLHAHKKQKASTLLAGQDSVIEWQSSNLIKPRAGSDVEDEVETLHAADTAKGYSCQ